MVHHIPHSFKTFKELPNINQKVFCILDTTSLVKLVIPFSRKTLNSSSSSLFTSRHSLLLQLNLTSWNFPVSSFFSMEAIMLPLGIMQATIQSDPMMFLTVTLTGS